MKTFRTLIMLLVGLGLLALPTLAASFPEIDALILTKEKGKIEEAITQLERLLEKDPQDGEILWHMAKAHLYLGDQLEENKLEVFERGKEYADLAVELLPSSPHTHYWQSALIGRIGQTRGILSSLFMVKPMKQALDQVLELDENYADAHWVLSQLYQQAPGFPLSIGNKKLALEHAEKAIALEPQNFDFRLQHALALEHNGRDEEALAVLTKLSQEPGLGADPKLLAEVEENYTRLSK